MKKAKWISLLFILILTGCSFPLFGSDEPEEQTLNIYLLRVTDPINSDLIRVLKEAADQFSLDHPKVKIHVDDTVAAQDYEDALLEKLKNNDVPDLVLVAPESLSLLAEKNVLADLSGLAESDDLPNDAFYQPFIDLMSRDGEWLAVPFGADPMVVFYNKDWFDQAGLPYPEGDWTWEQFEDTALELKKANRTEGITRYGGILSFNIFGLESLILGNGGHILSPDGKTASGYLDSPESVKAVQYAVDFSKEQELADGFVSPLDGYNMGGHFFSRNAGMVVVQSTARYFFGPELGDRLGVAPLPSFAGGHRANVVYSMGIGIPRQSEHKKTAWDFIQTLTMEKNDHTAKIGKWLLSTHKLLAKELGQLDDPIQRVFHSELEAIEQPAAFINPYFAETVSGSAFNALFEKLYREEVDVQTELTTIAKLLDEQLAGQRAADAQDE